MQIKHISTVTIGEMVVDLGEILEIEETASQYAIVISRLDEKQAIKFDKDMFLITI